MDSNTDIMNTLFDKNVVFVILTILGIFFIVYLNYHLFFANNTTNESMTTFSTGIDIFMLSITIVLCILFFLTTNTDASNVFSYSLIWMRRFLEDPLSIFNTLFLILILYIIVYLLRIPMTKESKPLSILIIEWHLWIALVIIVFTDILLYGFGINVAEFLIPDQLINFFQYSSFPILQSQSQVGDISGNTSRHSEVFNISNNIYTYTDAQDVCNLYGARLATYKEIEDSYNKGGEWCNYGWSDGQMILFPTQYSTWSNLQKNENTKNNCGRPGINGGFVDNPYALFGVNCFGIKPAPNEIEKKMIQINSQNNSLTTTIPSLEDLAKQAKKQYWLDHSNNLLRINAFNLEKWSQ